MAVLSGCDGDWCMDETTNIFAHLSTHHFSFLINHVTILWGNFFFLFIRAFLSSQSFSLRGKSTALFQTVRSLVAG